jgi:ligand-binding sensor domain-containing protein
VIFSQCLAVERWKNYLWLGSNDGLVKLDLETGETTPFRSVTSNRDYRALAVNDTIAVMTSSRGMSMLFHKNKKPFEREFTTDDGLPSSNVFELKIDGDFVWIGTDRGLTRFWWNNPSRVD